MPRSRLLNLAFRSELLVPSRLAECKSNGALSKTLLFEHLVVNIGLLAVDSSSRRDVMCDVHFQIDCVLHSGSSLSLLILTLLFTAACIRVRSFLLLATIDPLLARSYVTTTWQKHADGFLGTLRGTFSLVLGVLRIA